MRLEKVIYKDMPCEVRGLVVTDADGFNTIILNSRLSHDANLKTYQHELLHITRNDFQNDDPIGIIEKEVHSV